MIKISNLRVPASAGDSGLTAYIAKLLGIPEQTVKSLRILKRSVDARKNYEVCFVYTVAFSTKDEDELLNTKSTIVTPYAPPEPYAFPTKKVTPEQPPVVVGMGPAGLFAALCLAQAGLKPIILERGKQAEERAADVELFWKKGRLNEGSNVQFGEGGAGTFSDGKLTTGLNDERIPFILKTLVGFGAPEDIMYLAKPHIGTDRLLKVVVAMRQELLRLGSDIRFGHRLDGLNLDNNCVKSVEVTSDTGTYTLETGHVILAPGNSARDTFEMLQRSGVTLSAKSFSVGVRIEHLQSQIDKIQYGQAATLGTLPASDYKLAIHLNNDRSAYTFCVCPGGRVIASSSAPGQVVINGMSEYARDGLNCNGGLLVSVTPADFEGDALSGMRFQQELEKTAYAHGGANYYAPAQLVGDFLEKRPSTKSKTVAPSYTPGVRWGNLWNVLPPFICEAIAEALPKMERKIRGFNNPDAVLTAVETRSSSPVRIDREEYQAVGIKGLYPCGEGSGYAGGIMSASVDGIRAAEAVCALLS